MKLGLSQYKRPQIELFENRVLTRLHNEEFVTCMVHQMLLGQSNHGERDGWGMQHIWERLEMYKIFWLVILKGRDHLEDLSTDGRIILDWIIGKQVRRCGLDSSGSG
jgi:hypothetical protein